MDTATPDLILASASPRRHHLLTLLGVTFSVCPSDAEEQDGLIPDALQALLPDCPVSLSDHPTVRAWRKAADIYTTHPTSVVLAADTIVVLADQVLNKPDDPNHARAMLTSLSGRTHRVYTGLCLYHPGHDLPRFELVHSDVTLAALQPTDIDWYISTGEPLDKAGSYGIQGLGGRLVEQVVGSHTAIVGFPLPNVSNLLVAAGITPRYTPQEAYDTWLQDQQKETPPWPQAQL